jgi:hypothetical protein
LSLKSTRKNNKKRIIKYVVVEFRGEREVEESNQENDTRREEAGGEKNINSIWIFIDHLHSNNIVFFNYI